MIGHKGSAVRSGTTLWPLWPQAANRDIRSLTTWPTRRRVGSRVRSGCQHDHFAHGASEPEACMASGSVFRSYFFAQVRLCYIRMHVRVCLCGCVSILCKRVSVQAVKISRTTYSDHYRGLKCSHKSQSLPKLSEASAFKALDYSHRWPRLLNNQVRMHLVLRAGCCWVILFFLFIVHI